MRIKWNRHLDGRSSRRPDEETAGTQEADDKKGGATASSSSTPGIFKIFRRKKKRSGGDEIKTDDGNNCFVVPQQPPPLRSDAAEDDCASISSVATCASQPVTDGFHRDRSSSLFSSFRLSLPGSKRKKRKIAPTPSETLLNGQQQNEPQVDRYSTPDLRKPPDKLDPTNHVAQVSLSTSSPSIRTNGNSKGIPSSSAQSLDVQQNSESLDKFKWSKSVPSSKLSKSVSFSDCCKDGDGGGLIDSSHSAGDNKALRAVNCTAMVEENSGALESESAACLSDNLRMSRESKFTALGDCSRSSSAVSSCLQKRPHIAAADATASVVMTKTEEVVTGRNSKQSAIADIGDILNDIATEIQSYGKGNSVDRFCSANEGSQVTSTVNCDSVNYSNGHSHETIIDDELLASKENKRYETRVDSDQSPIVQCIETLTNASSTVSERNTDLKIYDHSYENATKLSYNENNDSTTERYRPDKHAISSLNTKLEVLTSELSVLTAAKNLSKLTCDTIVKDVPSGVDKDSSASGKQCEMSVDSPLERQCVITSDKHVVCRMKIYEESLVTNSDDSKVVNLATSPTFKNSAIKSSSENFVSHENVLQYHNSLSETKLVHSDILISEPKSKPCFDSENFPSKLDPLSVESSALNLCSVSVTNCDQKVPECHKDELNHIYENNNCLQNDQQVPEFELSLKEFEEVCSRYMSRSTPEFSDYDSTFPLYGNSPKPKSVLDLSYSFIYPNFHEEEVGNTSDVHFRVKGEVSSIPTDLILENIKPNSHLQSSCQSPKEERRQRPLPMPPKQWINDREKPIDRQSSCPSDNVCTDGVQRTNARGKYLCQEPCPGALPTTAVVMHGDSDSGGFDTPQLSSTLQAFETESGRETGSSIFTGEKQQLFSDASSSDDMMISSTAVLSTLNSVLDCSYESPGKKDNSVFLDSEIRDPYRGPRAICDPLIYGNDVTAKGLESLAPDHYLNCHNFSDIRSVGFCEVISDDYVPTGKGLIEISNPYEDTFILHQDLSKQNLVRDVNVSLLNGEKVSISSVRNIETPVNENHNSENITPKLKDVEKSVSLSDVSEINSADKLIPNGSEHAKEDKLAPHVEQKNLKNKNSMIPCRKKATPNNENNSKRIETKSKSKKSNSLPRFNKTESHLPVKNNSSHRVLSTSCKDSVVEPQLRGKRKDLPVKNSSNYKPIGNCVDVSSSVNNNVSGKTLETSEFSSNSQLENLTVFDDSRRYAAEEKNSSLLVEPPHYSNGAIITLEENSHSRSSVVDFNDNTLSVPKNETDDSKSVLSTTSTDNILEIDTRRSGTNNNSTSLKIIGIFDSVSECAASVSENNDGLVEEICPECCANLDVQDHVDILSLENVKRRYCSKHSDYSQQCSRRSSLSAVGMRKTSYTSSKESLSSQLTSSSNRGKSRIPRILSKIKRSVSGTFTTKRNSNSEQPGTRGAQPSSKGPVRPPMWLSKAELTQEIQRLGTLCEARTKELNRLKMETKHVSVGFDAFAALFKYMVEDLNGLSVPALTKDLEKTLKQLELTKQDLAYYEREVEEMKSHHCQELNDLSNKLFEVYQSEVAELNAKHQEEINHLKSDHQIQIEHLKATFDTSSSEAKAQHEKLIASLEQEIINQREELQEFQEREIKDLEEKHAESSKLLQEHIEQLQKKCAELKQHSMSMEDAMQKDTDSKLQWVTSAKLDLEKEVESLKTVLEMKNKELHTLRVQNLEMEKQLEELPFAREKIKMLQARAEDLEALMVEKTKLERKLSTENQQMKETFEKEAKVNRRLSMENEELQWRLKQAENSLISGSFSEVPEFPEVEENAVASPTKSPPQMLSRSVFFTFVDKEEGTPHSPRSQYKKITPNFSANYKTSPAKSSKSPPAPSPRRGKSHSEPPQPITITSTPRKVAKTPLSKNKQKRPRSGSDSVRPNEHMEVNFSSVTESMASSVSSESSVFEHRERLLDEHKEHIIQSLEILREQRSIESNADEPSVIEKKWCSDDIKVTGELSNLETEDMSRSAEFSDPKTYYHMTFPVLKESGINDCDIEDGCKNSSSGNSPLKEVNSTHSMSENNLHRVVETSDTLHVMSMSSQEINTTVLRIENKQISCTESSLSAENVQREAASGVKAENRWRTI